MIQCAELKNVTVTKESSLVDRYVSCREVFKECRRISRALVSMKFYRSNLSDDQIGFLPKKIKMLSHDDEELVFSFEAEVQGMYDGDSWQEFVVPTGR